MTDKVASDSDGSLTCMLCWASKRKVVQDRFNESDGAEDGENVYLGQYRRSAMLTIIPHQMHRLPACSSGKKKAREASRRSVDGSDGDDEIEYEREHTE